MGKLSVSSTISVRAGSVTAASAARISLYSTTVVESAMMVCPGAAPRTARPSWSPMACGSSSHSSSQPRISRPPQLSWMKLLMSVTVRLSGRPRELPSR